MWESGVRVLSEFYFTYELPREGGGAEVSVADGGERHQAPPERVQEGPLECIKEMAYKTAPF